MTTKTQSIEQRVIELICEQLSVESEKVSADSHFINDLGADSLDTVEMIMSFEEAFEVDIPDEIAEQIKTVADVIRLVSEKQAA